MKPGTVQKDSDAYVLCSSAWNLLANGEKAWRLLSPGASVAAGLLDPMLLERITDRCAYEVHVVQRPGNLLVAPSVWAHSVVNLSHTIALTGNFVNESNYLTVKRYFDIHEDPAWIHDLPKLAQAASSSRSYL
jgi:hypothetical protein